MASNPMKVCMHNILTLMYYTTERNPVSASKQPQQGHFHRARRGTQNGLRWGCFEAEVRFWGMVRYTLGRLMFMPSLVSLGWAASELEAGLCLAAKCWAVLYTQDCSSHVFKGKEKLSFSAPSSFGVKVSVASCLNWGKLSTSILKSKESAIYLDSVVT